MTRAFIFAGLGLLLALIISAATYSQKNPLPKTPTKIWLDQKCRESGSEKDAHHECHHRLGTYHDHYADIFLRPVKRKIKMVYA
jgi:hypothetical protein